MPTSYGAVVEAMVNDELDLAYFGGLTYVQARNRGEVTPLVTEINPRTADATYRRSRSSKAGTSPSGARRAPRGRSTLP